MSTLSIFLVFVGSLFSVAAQASTVVQITPQALLMEVGEKTQFSVEIIEAENLFGFELHISYDPTKVKVLDADPSIAGIQLFPGDMYEVSDGFLVANEADNEVGKALFAFTLLAPASPLVGDGTMVKFELEAIGEGTTEIDLEEVIIASPDGEVLPFVANNGEVIIEGEPQVTPGLTASPTGESTLIATAPVSPTETPKGVSPGSSIPTTLETSSTVIPDRETTPQPLSTTEDSLILNQVNQNLRIFGLVILGLAILLVIGGTLYLIRLRHRRG